MEEYNERYSLAFWRSEGENNTQITVNFSEECLPDVLSKVRDFLVAAGFSYITSLTAFSENGEHSSDEI